MRHSLFVLVVAALSFASQARDAGCPGVKPETVGFSSARLQRLDAGMKALVDDKQLAGIVTMVARHGQVVQQSTYGYQDVASKTPMRQDSIFRIYSMTKPITGVAMMMLYEEGKWKPSDPISRYIPEFRDLKVFTGVDKDGNAHARGAEACTDDGRAHVAHRRLHLWLLRRLARRQDVSAGEPARVRFAQGIHRQDGDAPARIPAGRRLDVQRLGRHSGLPRGEALGAVLP